MSLFESRRSAMFVWFAGIVGSLAGTALGDGTLVASYGFQTTLSADQAGQLDLLLTDPFKDCHFETATVFGVERTVFRYEGGDAPEEQAGLTYVSPIITSGVAPGVISPESYSVELVVSFDLLDGWVRILDSQSRSTDNGFYVNPEQQLDVYPNGGGGSAVTANEFHHIVITVSPQFERSFGNVLVYLDGEFQIDRFTDVMFLDASRSLNMFLDNNQGPAQDEFSNGRIALARFYDGALSGDQVKELYDGLVPAPGAAAAMSLGGLAMLRRRRA